MPDSTEPTVSELVKMLAAMREKQNELTPAQWTELRKAAEWLMPKPTLPDRTVQGIRFLPRNPRNR
jgi:alkyl hydroperoxide reductase subunit AhpC